ncbi:penicillin acylase family protein, partial [Butyricicoccus sp. 1XD8-22]
TSNDMKAIQSDKKNLYAEEFLPHILETLKKMDTEGKYEEIITLLEEWEMFDNKDEAAPLVFNLLMDNVQKTLYDGKLPEDIYELMPAKYQVTDQLLRDAYAGNPGVWVTEAGGIDQVIFDSFEITITDIKSKYGTKASKWTWGSYNKLTFDHPLSAASDFLAQYINPSKQSVGGSRITVQAAGNDGQGNVNHGASWRFVVDLNDLSHSFQLVAPGQSGHVKSKWYDDQSADWVYGRYHQTNIDGNLIKTYELILKSQ